MSQPDTQPDGDFELPDHLRAAPSPAEPDAGGKFFERDGDWFEDTGEYRLPKENELYLEHNGGIYVAKTDFSNNAKMIIREVSKREVDLSAALATANADKLELLRKWTEGEAALAEARQRIETLTSERNERWSRWEETETARINAVNQLAEARRENERLKAENLNLKNAIPGYRFSAEPSAPPGSSEPCEEWQHVKGVDKYGQDVLEIINPKE